MQFIVLLLLIAIVHGSFLRPTAATTIFGNGHVPTNFYKIALVHGDESSKGAFVSWSDNGKSPRMVLDEFRAPLVFTIRSSTSFGFSRGFTMQYRADPRTSSIYVVAKNNEIVGSTYESPSTFKVHREYLSSSMAGEGWSITKDTPEGPMYVASTYGSIYLTEDREARASFVFLESHHPTNVPLH